MKRNRAVFLDRDGVLNASTVRNGRPYAPTSLEKFNILPGVVEAVQKLHDAGYLTIVITNQPDVAEGKVSQDTVDEFHRLLKVAMPLTEIVGCYHAKDAGCACRKPKPGMLLDAVERHGINLRQSALVGDRWRDIDAAFAVACTSYFIDYGYEEVLKQQPDFIVSDLPEAVRLILNSA